MRRFGKRRTLTTIGVAVLALFMAQLPNTSAPAVTYCIGPAAYPPDLPDCLDPVKEAKKKQIASLLNRKLQQMQLRKRLVR